MITLLKHLVSLSFWFGMYPEPLSGWFYWSFFVVTLLALSGAVVTGIWFARKKATLATAWKKFWGQAIWFQGSAAIVGWYLLFVTEQRVPVLGMRVFFLVWLIVFGWWKWHLYRMWTRISQEEAQQETARHLQKWIPKPKHKK
jgi:hypothetical protein